MSKYFWYEVYTYNESKPGTTTVETFDSFSEAQRYIVEHKDLDLYVDEWQMNADGSNMIIRSLV